MSMFCPSLALQIRNLSPCKINTVFLHELNKKNNLEHDMLRLNYLVDFNKITCIRTLMLLHYIVQLLIYSELLMMLVHFV